MAESEPPDLIALICSRLCHDLAGSIGAVNNGVELLAEETDAAMREEAIGLIAQAAQDAARRLAFFRLALGASGGGGDPMPLGELTRIARSYFASPKLQLDLPAQQADLPKPLGKALLLGLALVANALPRGGNLRLSPAGSGWRIAGSGPMLRWSDDIAAALHDAAAPPQEPMPAIACYVRLLLRQAGLGIAAQSGDSGITLDIAP